MKGTYWGMLAVLHQQDLLRESDNERLAKEARLASDKAADRAATAPRMTWTLRAFRPDSAERVIAP